MNDQVEKLRAYLATSPNELLTVQDIARGSGMPVFEITKLLRFVRPAWEHADHYDRRELLKLLPQETIDDSTETFADELPLQPLGTKLVLEGRKP